MPFAEANALMKPRGKQPKGAFMHRVLLRNRPLHVSLWHFTTIHGTASFRQHLRLRGIAEVAGAWGSASFNASNSSLRILRNRRHGHPWQSVLGWTSATGLAPR